MGTLNPKLFRPEAMAKLDSFGDLNRSFTVASTRSWIILVALALLLVTVLLWAAFGTLVVSVEVPGILLRGGRVMLATSTVPGKIESLRVTVGQKVGEGEILGWLEPTEKGAPKQEILTPCPGTVSAIYAWPGQVLPAGSPVASVDPEGEPLLATLFAPSGTGKKIQAGMKVQILPEGFGTEEHGYLLAEVVSVSVLPSTPSGMMSILGNELLVRQFSAGGAPIQIEVALQPDATAPGGYAWSASKGPATPITSGHPCTARIIIDRSPALARLFPALAGVAAKGAGQ
jgi:pyruvate/2-oxoglutarate dehydrogenase complex dihydrolipoamide acyltransferase (E2) component